MGAIENESDYYPFGGERVVSQSVTDQNYKFTGKERDAESGLDYCGARYFSSITSRWLTPDWSATPTAVPYADFSDPQSLNQYGYVRNNPMSHADLDGHCDENGICGILAGAAQGTGNFIKNTVVGTAQFVAASDFERGQMMVQPVVTAGQDYADKGVSGVANQVLD